MAFDWQMVYILIVTFLKKKGGLEDELKKDHCRYILMVESHTIRT